MMPFVLPTPVSEIVAVQTQSEVQRQSFAGYAVSLQDDREWRSFVATLAKTGRFSREQINAVTLMWDVLKGRIPAPLPLPLTQPTASGNIQMAWDAGRHYLEIDIRPDLAFEWFYRDRETNLLEGTEDAPDSSISPALMNALRRIVFS